MMKKEVVVVAVCRNLRFETQETWRIQQRPQELQVKVTRSWWDLLDYTGRHGGNGLKNREVISHSPGWRSPYFLSKRTASPAKHSQMDVYGHFGCRSCSKGWVYPERKVDEWLTVSTWLDALVATKGMEWHDEQNRGICELPNSLRHGEERKGASERLGEAESEGQTKARPRQREDFRDNLAAVAGYMEENQPGSSSLALALSDARIGPGYVFTWPCSFVKFANILYFNHS